MTDITTDLSLFGIQELKMLEQLLKAYRLHGLPENMNDDEVTPMLNTQSGCVFLSNSDYQTAMMNGDKLEMWHTCSYCGHEGFLEDFEHSEDDKECVEQMMWAGVEKYQDKEVEPIAT